MHTTVFDTPIVRSVFRLISILYLRIFGWRVEGRLPEHPRYVIIAAPHTSNWDFPITLFLAFALRINCSWMGKDSLFRRPFGAIMRWLGGMPIDRSKSNNIVGESIKAFDRQDRLVMVIPPEGTRKQVSYWKTVFYHIAHGAQVPIVLGYIDYERKAGGIGPIVWPSGDIEADMRIIQG
ncbi:MAG TPA: lysophospholipid acyltransferase family protein, partial [Deltaproteobacteria bacterium]|nr:lysophospholipid acyltransferase family protein [Deltaproteobacteria bacterium]